MKISSLAHASANEQFIFPSSATKHTLGYVGRTPGTPVRDSDAWYTPSLYVNSVRAVMGSIDLDPFSSEEANTIIGASYFFSPLRSAFTHTWRSGVQKRRYPAGVTVFMNPPYSAGLIGEAVARFVSVYQSGEIRQAIVLVNNASDTRWFRALRLESQSACFTDHRIAFTTRDGKHEAGNTRGQVFFYYAKPEDNRSAQFRHEFEQYGWVIDCHARYGSMS